MRPTDIPSPENENPSPIPSGELCEGGTLRARLDKTSEEIAPIDQLRWARQISYGLYQLHRVRIVHRDLKGENILLDKLNHAKVADFGLSLGKSHSTSHSKTGLGRGGAGTIPWMAPELHQDKSNSKETDVYSLGVVLWEIVSRKMPYAGLMVGQMISKTVTGRRDPLPEPCPEVFQLMITACLNLEAKQRPTAEQVGDQFAAALKSVESIPPLVAPESLKPVQAASPNDEEMKKLLAELAKLKLEKAEEEKRRSMEEQRRRELEKRVEEQAQRQTQLDQNKQPEVAQQPTPFDDDNPFDDDSPLADWLDFTPLAPEPSEPNLLQAGLKGQREIKRQQAELKKLPVMPKPATPASFFPKPVIPLPDLVWDHRGIRTESTQAVYPTINSRDDQLLNSELASPRSRILSSSSQMLIPAPKPLLKPADAKTLEPLLQLVAEGEQDKAEALIQKDKNLLLHAGTVTDLSGREFKQITAFQYALWALDWHMWTMIQKYLPKESQAEQLQALESKGTVHGKHFSLQPLTEALQMYVDNAEKGWTYDRRAVDQWCKEVRGEQKLLPAHVINEYCRLDRLFEPCPSEWELRLPRTQEIDMWDNIQSKNMKGSWFVALSSKDGLGSGFLYSRRRGIGPMVAGGGGGGRFIAVAARVDLKALQSLWKARTQQWEVLKSELLLPVVSLGLLHSSDIRNNGVAELEHKQKQIVQNQRTELKKIPVTPQPVPPALLSPASPLVWQPEIKKPVTSELVSPRSEILSSSLQTSIPTPKLLLKPMDEKALSQLLRLVAEGEQDQAETLIKEDQNLLLHAGRLTDLSGREFQKITAFQYALWAMDWHMWTMIQKYLPKESQAEQLQALESKGTPHGKHFSLEELLDALWVFFYGDGNKGMGKWHGSERVKNHWCRVVGGAQKMLPAHAVDGYYCSGGGFNPHNGKRTREVNLYDSTRDKLVKGTWFGADGLGLNFAFYKYKNRSYNGCSCLPWPSGYAIPKGYSMALCGAPELESLWKTCTQQLEVLKSELLLPVVSLGLLHSSDIRSNGVADLEHKQIVQNQRMELKKIPMTPQEVPPMRLSSTSPRVRQPEIKRPLTSEPVSPSSGVLSSSSQTLIPAPKPLLKSLDAKTLERLLQFVAEGEQDKVEALIQEDQNLLLHAGTVKDLSGREFKHITAFQYALWAMDYHMWTMIQKYLPKESQAEQLQALESEGTAHGRHFSLKELTDALQVYVDNAAKWNYDQRAEDRYWCKKVGGAQTRLPAHVVNEYCRKDRAFEPCPLEWESKLPRTRGLMVWNSTRSTVVYGSWFIPPSSKDGLGVNYAFVKHGKVMDLAWAGMMRIRGKHVRARCDLEALQSLWKTRTQQLESLKSQLLSTPNYNRTWGVR